MIGGEPRPDLDEAEYRTREVVRNHPALDLSRVLDVLLAEYDRRGAALAERDAEVARLRREVQALRSTALAAAPTEDEDKRAKCPSCGERGSWLPDGYCAYCWDLLTSGWAG